MIFEFRLLLDYILCRDIGYCHQMSQMQKRTEVEQDPAAAVSNLFQHAVELVAFGFWHRRDGSMWLHAFLMLSGVSASV